MVKKIKEGYKFFNLALLSFLTLSFDVLSIGITNYLVFGKFEIVYSDVQLKSFWFVIIARSLVYIVWGLSAYLLINKSKKKFNFDIFNVEESKKKFKMWQWLIIAFSVIFSFSLSYYSWGGFKLYLEFLSHGLFSFTLQFIYYLFEVALFTLIIVFGQKAFEIWFSKKNIPYGGIVVAFTWGLIHFFTKDIATGISTTLISFLFGSIYVIANKNIKITYIVLCFMFML